MNRILLPGLLLMCCVQAQGLTDKYRLTLRSDPSGSIVIAWNQVSGSNPMVCYGPVDHDTLWNLYPFSQPPDRSVNYLGMDNQFARIFGLLADTAYYFVIKDSEGVSARFWFKTAPNNPAERLSIIAGGDSRSIVAARRNANKLVAKLRPHMVLFGGDMINSGTSALWQAWLDDWQLTTGSDGRMIPIIVARGNHEASNGMLVDLFDVPSPEVYYALTFGGNLLRTYTLNTEISISGSQTTWLHDDLWANSNVTWKIAQYHKPMRPHVAYKSEGHDQYFNWAPLFYQYGVRLVMECHVHTVKTTWPLKPFNGAGSEEGFVIDTTRGTVYVGEGCWGAPLRNSDDNKSWTRNSGSFNQFKWIFVDQNKIEVRTVKVDNADQVGQVNDTAIFTPPTNLDIWNPGNGNVIVINANQNNNNAAPSVILTNPLDGTEYISPLQILIDALASDGDGSVQKVDFYYNISLIGSDVSTPYSVNWSIPANGYYNLTAIATDNLGATTTSLESTVFVGTSHVNTSSVIKPGSDDAEEDSSGTVFISNLELKMVDIGGGNNQTIGLRFRDLGIPPNAIINSAYIQFTSSEVARGLANLAIHGQRATNAAQFLVLGNNISGRPKTTASVTWNPSSWLTTNTSGQVQKTPDLSPVIQEIVNINGWNRSSPVCFIITGTGRRIALSFEGSPANAARLYINYSYQVASGIEKYTQQQFTIHPNPTSGKFEIESWKPACQSDRLEVGEVQVFDLLGQEMTGVRHKVSAGAVEVDLSGHSNGIYFVRVGDKVQKVVLSK